MLSPKKHITIYESLLGVCGFILKSLKESEKSVDDIWSEFKRINDSRKFPGRHSFDNFILAIDVLYAINKVEQNNFKLKIK